MKYNNATLEGRLNLLIIGLLEKTKKTKQHTIFTTKTTIKSILKYNNQIYTKNHNKIKFASDKNLNKTF